ncbi:hypothetical protein [Gaetbulibacter sp. PBL-D1]|uniref:hypothetical protein n=1 Tax=Gaetbulibacter sp. PBL-D1 TaxID=3422594 RepID=UPI003D2F1D5A
MSGTLIQWEYKKKNDSFGSNLIRLNNLVVFEDDHSLYAIDLDTREEIWSYRDGHSVTLMGNRLFFLEKNYLLEIDFNSGKILSKRKFGEEYLLNLRIVKSTLSFNTSKFKYYFNINDPDKVKKISGPWEGPDYSKLSEDYLFDNGGKSLLIYSFNPFSKAHKLKCGSSITSNIFLIDNQVYVGCEDGSIHEFDLISNEHIVIKHKFKKTDDLEFIDVHRLIISGNKLITCSLLGFLTVRDKYSKRILWELNCETQIHSIEIQEDLIIIGTPFVFYIINIENGFIEWKYENYDRFDGNYVNTGGLLIWALEDESEIIKYYKVERSKKSREYSRITYYKNQLFFLNDYNKHEEEVVGWDDEYNTALYDMWESRHTSLAALEVNLETENITSE